MKNIIINLVVIVFFTLLSSTAVLASAPPPPPPGGPTGNEQPIGGGMAPIGSGLVVMLSMGSAYGARKVYQLRKKEEE